MPLQLPVTLIHGIGEKHCFNPNIAGTDLSHNEPSCTQSPQTVENDIHPARTLPSTPSTLATTTYHPTRPKMASNPSTSTYELVFHPPTSPPTSPKGHTSLFSAQAARSAVLYQRTDHPTPPLQGTNTLHTKLLNLNQPCPIGPLIPRYPP